MTTRTMSDSSLELTTEYAPKHPRLETVDSDAQSSIDTTESPFPHRKTLKGRATLCNAADTRHFRNSRALIYTFVDIFDIGLDKLGWLASCTLRCGICQAAAPRWPWIKGSKSGGSTTNMNSHMDQKHTLIWQNACWIDKAARAGSTLVDETLAASVQY
ncbi:hypothetical protein RSAG8_13867, partial [Rhizoctonia solani AG-8 WAC10335]